MSNDILTVLATEKTKENILKMIETAEQKNMEEGMTEEALASAFVSNENLKKVEVHVYKGMMKVDFGKVTELNLSSFEEDEKQYGEKNGNNFIVSAFGEQLKKISSIENSIRAFRNDCAVGNSVYMNLDSFEGKFYDKFSEKKTAFDEVVEEIRMIYDREVEEFKKYVKQMAYKLCPDRQKEIMNSLSRQTNLSADQFCNKFKLGLSTEFQINQLSNDALKDVVQQSRKAFIKKQYSDLIMGMMQELFKATSVYFKGVADCVKEDLGSMKATKRNLRNAAEKVRKDNVADLPLITYIVDSMIQLSDEEFKTLAEEQAYEILAVLYGKAQSLGIELDATVLPSGDYEITPSELLDFYNDMM